MTENSLRRGRGFGRYSQPASDGSTDDASDAQPGVPGDPLQRLQAYRDIWHEYWQAVDQLLADALLEAEQAYEQARARADVLRVVGPEMRADAFRVGHETAGREVHSLIRVEDNSTSSEEEEQS